MNKFIPLTILFVVIFLIAIATRNLSNKQSDNATNSQETSLSNEDDDPGKRKEDGGAEINFSKIPFRHFSFNFETFYVYLINLTAF